MRHDHYADLAVLAIIAVGVMILAGLALRRNDAAESSAWTAVLMAIISSIKERWSQRSVDRMSDQLAGSSPTPPTTPQPVEVVNNPDKPVPVEPTA